MLNQNNQPGFEDFRRERARHRRQTGEANRPAVDASNALRELEEAEARELKNQQLTREVQEFFDDAQRQAAAIVEKVAENARAENAERLEQEMEAFLFDAFRRMNHLVARLLEQRGGRDVAQEDLEPRMRALVGSALDAFRCEGTAEIGDRHLGQDPAATDLDELRRELTAMAETGDAPGEEAAAEPPAGPDVEAHPVAELLREAPEAEPADDGADAEAEKRRFQQVLKGLVRKGLMTRDEARAAWQARAGGSQVK